MVMQLKKLSAIKTINETFLFKKNDVAVNYRSKRISFISVHKLIISMETKNFSQCLQPMETFSNLKKVYFAYCTTGTV